MRRTTRCDTASSIGQHDGPSLLLHDPSGNAASPAAHVERDSAALGPAKGNAHPAPGPARSVASTFSKSEPRRRWKTARLLPLSLGGPGGRRHNSHRQNQLLPPPGLQLSFFARAITDPWVRPSAAAIAGRLAFAANIFHRVASCSAVQGRCTPTINTSRVSLRLTMASICRFLARQKRVCKANGAHFETKRSADIDTVAKRGSDPRSTRLGPGLFRGPERAHPAALLRVSTYGVSRCSTRRQSCVHPWQEMVIRDLRRVERTLTKARQCSATFSTAARRCGPD